MKVRIDTSRCTGHAQCAAQDPDLFALDDDGYALPLDAEVPTPVQGRVRAGAQACPERAITIVE
jgi:ferredoxin